MYMPPSKYQARIPIFPLRIIIIIISIRQAIRKSWYRLGGVGGDGGSGGGGGGGGGSGGREEEKGER